MSVDYYLLTFVSSNHAIMAEKALKEHYHTVMLPTPRVINASCGLSLKIADSDKSLLYDDVAALQIPCALYEARGYRGAFQFTRVHDWQ